MSLTQDEGAPRRHGRSLCNPPSLQGSASEKESETDDAPATKFEEWPLGNTVLKRVTMDGAPATFVVQARYTGDDDAEILQLKEKGMSWVEIAKHFPGRSKTANTSRRGVRQPHDHSQTPLVVDGHSSEEEWVLRRFFCPKKPADGGVELLVKWKGGEETWEPYENMAETEALGEYKRLSGTLTVDTVDAA
ncbi:hypothetical protein C7999DRAFT_44666 [Corynascus novoguineensis]|uniref:Chromo domain-containing protein n=1 Tax=Corynascus novoguineensis TaxID=1126955 RepID=A0AAN7CK04_9PEZI|nr:hypothetical protein C7999DRAFT_44666 [Corynascus novoguineensis]